MEFLYSWRHVQTLAKQEPAESTVNGSESDGIASIARVKRTTLSRYVLMTMHRLQAWVIRPERSRLTSGTLLKTHCHRPDQARSSATARSSARRSMATGRCVWTHLSRVTSDLARENVLTALLPSDVVATTKRPSAARGYGFPSQSTGVWHMCLVAVVDTQDLPWKRSLPVWSS